MYTQYTSTSHQCRIFLSGKRSDWISHQSFSSTFTESSKNAREAARQQRRKTPSTKKEGGGEIVMKTVSWTWNFLNVIWQHWNIAINVASFLCWALLYLYYKKWAITWFYLTYLSFFFSELQKPPDNNVFNLSAQDLLSKSHEELVLLLIHLRRQMATLSEAIDGSRSELENITNTIGKWILLLM